MATTADLGRQVKAKYPGAYDDMPDEALGASVKAKYPGAYDDFADGPSVGMGDVKAAEGRDAAREEILSSGSNTPVSMRTGDPAADRQIAASLFDAGHTRALTKADATRAAAVTLGGVVGLGAGVPAAVASGALTSGGLSEADDAAGVGKDALVGGAVSGGLAKLIPAAFGLLGRKAGSKLASASAKADEIAQKATDKKVASLRGSYGAARQDESRAIEVLLRAESTGALTPEMAAQLQALKGSPEWTEAIRNVAQNYMDDMPGMASKVTRAKGEFQAFDPVAEQAAEKARTLSGSEAKAQIASRLKRYGPMGLAGAAAGQVVGGPFGMLLGGASGAAVRPMIHAVRRGYQHPAVQTAVWSPVERLARSLSGTPPAAFTPAGPAAASAADPYLDELIAALTGRKVRLVPAAAEEESP
jgi:hypothetical protein